MFLFFSSSTSRPAVGAGQHRRAEPGGSGSRRGRWSRSRRRSWSRRRQSGASGRHQQHDDGENEHRHLRPEEAIRPHQEEAAAAGDAALHPHRWVEEEVCSSCIFLYCFYDLWFISDVSILFFYSFFLELNMHQLFLFQTIYSHELLKSIWWNHQLKIPWQQRRFHLNTKVSLN